MSIVTPVLNGGSYFADCLESVAALARAVPGAIEHIIADGGSTDGTIGLARAALASRESPVSVVLDGPDRGQSHAINRGVAHSRGAWFAWLNADDLFAAGAAGVVGRLAAGGHDDADVVVGRCRFVNTAGDVVFSPTPPDLTTSEDLLRPLSRWFAGRCIVQPEAIVRREAFERVGGLDETNHLAMDHDLWLRFVALGARIEVVGDQVALQRVHDGQKTANNLGVARQILDNCERYLGGGPTAEAEVVAELDELRDRIRTIDAVLRVRHASTPLSETAVAASIRSAVDLLPRPCRSVLAIGESAYQACRDGGLDGASLVRAARPVPSPAGFDAVVADCAHPSFGAGAVDAAWRATRHGGTLVLGGSASADAIARARRSAVRALGERVTWRHRPWTDSMLAAAKGVMGWTARRSGHRLGANRAQVIRRVSVAAWHIDAAWLGVDLNDLAVTTVLRRPSE